MMDIMETEQETTNADQSTHKLSQNLIEMGFSANAAQMALAAVAPMDDEQLRQDIAMTWILDNEQMIQQKESDELVAKLAAEEEVDQEVQDDFLIAMQLQQQEDAEYIAAREQAQRHNQQNQYDKVSISFKHHAIVEPEFDFGSGSDHSDDEDEEECYWDDYGDEIDDINVTKHDAKNCGRQNAKVLEGCSQMQMATGNLVESGMTVSNTVFGELKQHGYTRERQRRVKNAKDENQKTVEGVMDRKTRVMLFNWVKAGLLTQVNGCFSTGKEASVYHATAGEELMAHFHEAVGRDNDEFDLAPGDPVALKLFKTTLNEFKNRADYINGDWRFRSCKLEKHNPRKIVKLWAQKERNNLIRMRNAGILCPQPLHLKDHALMMSFIGTQQGRPAPKLKDVQLSASRLKNVYQELLLMMKTMWSEAHLVHADLSEYNMLYHEQRLYIIDVAQAIDRSHPQALNHLEKDCQNVTTFFTRQGVPNILSVPELVEFVTGATETFIGMQDVAAAMQDPTDTSTSLHQLVEQLGNQHSRENSPVHSPKQAQQELDNWVV